MADTRDIEKKSLEAHVELCAERYRFLEEKLETMDEKISSVCDKVNDLYGVVQTMAEKRNDQIINWGIGIIGTLVGLVGWLLAHYVVK